jgi:hypothetical protein
MGKHDVPTPGPDPSRDGHKPGQFPPAREPGKHEKPANPRIRLASPSGRDGRLW